MTNLAGVSASSSSSSSNNDNDNNNNNNNSDSKSDDVVVSTSDVLTAPSKVAEATDEPVSDVENSANLAP